MRRHLAPMIAIVALAAAACSSEPTREDAIDEFESAGFTAETSECLIDDLLGQGFEMSDLTGDPSSEVEAGIESAVQNCMTGDDLGNMISEDELRERFVDGMASTDGFDEAQANCVADELESAGVTFTEMGSGADLDDQIQAAVEACR